MRHFFVRGEHLYHEEAAKLPRRIERLRAIAEDKERQGHHQQLGDEAEDAKVGQGGWVQHQLTKGEGEADAAVHIGGGDNEVNVGYELHIEGNRRYV